MGLPSFSETAQIAELPSSETRPLSSNNLGFLVADQRQSLKFIEGSTLSSSSPLAGLHGIRISPWLISSEFTQALHLTSSHIHLGLRRHQL